MSVTDLRKELKDMRKKVSPTPVSRMKKSECAAEIERLRSVHRGEEKKVEAVLEKAEVPKKVAKKVAAVQEVAHAKGEEVVKKTKSVKSEPVKEEKSKKEKPAPKKESKAGSEEMKARMAKLREMRKKKSDE